MRFVPQNSRTMERERKKSTMTLVNSKRKAAIKRYNLAKKKSPTMSEESESEGFRGAAAFFFRLPLDVFVIIGEFLGARSLV